MAWPVNNDINQLKVMCTVDWISVTDFIYLRQYKLHIKFYIWLIDIIRNRLTRCIINASHHTFINRFQILFTAFQPVFEVLL